MKKILSHCVSATALLLFACGTSQAQTVQFTKTQLAIGMNQIKAEVAATNAQREQGLKSRDKMATDAGMVFVYDAPAMQCVWMKDTLMPLSVAFINASGKIVNIEDMQPQTLDNHCSANGKPVAYALEMNLGWFKQKNIKPGTMVDGLPPLPKP